MGHIITIGGATPDPAKVADFLKMPPPQDIPGVKSLCGIPANRKRF